jgi:outer membrane protein
MRVFAVALTLSAVLTAGAAFAQAPAPAPATQKPAAPAPAPATQKPAAPATAPAAAPAPLTSVFGAGLKYAYVNLQQVAAESSEGKAAAEKIKGFNDQKVKELNEKNRVLQAAQQKLEQGGSVLSDAARTQLQTEIERQQRDIQRASEDAQQDLQNFSQQVQEDFNKKLNPIVDRVAKEKGVHFVFSAADAGLIWADPSLNLTPDVILAFNSKK